MHRHVGYKKHNMSTHWEKIRITELQLGQDVLSSHASGSFWVVYCPGPLSHTNHRLIVVILHMVMVLAHAARESVPLNRLTGDNGKRPVCQTTRKRHISSELLQTLVRSSEKSLALSVDERRVTEKVSSMLEKVEQLGRSPVDSCWELLLTLSIMGSSRFCPGLPSKGLI